MIKKRFLYFAIAFSLIVLLAVNSFSADVSKEFMQANEAYEKGDYVKAAELYEIALKEVKNEALYYNLGNSYFKEGKVGQALVNYLRAGRRAPNNSDLNDNIKYLRTLTKDNIEDKNPFSFINKIFFYYNFVNLKDFFFIFMLFNAMFFGLLIARLFVSKEFVNWLKNVALALLILSGIGCLLNYKTYFYDKRGVIISGEVSVKSGSSLNDTTMFNLHEGTEFKIIDENEDWLKILLPDNTKGWILKKVAEQV